MSERDVKAAIRLALGRRPDVRLFNNPVGEAWIGKATKLPNGDILLRGAQRVTYGLVVGSGDLVGWKRVLITPDMIGQHLAQFLSAEIKGDRGRRRPEQDTWRTVVNAAGGRAGVVRSVEDALELVGDAT